MHYETLYSAIQIAEMATVGVALCCTAILISQGGRMVIHHHRRRAAHKAYGGN